MIFLNAHNSVGQEFQRVLGLLSSSVPSGHLSMWFWQLCTWTCQLLVQRYSWEYSRSKEVEAVNGLRHRLGNWENGNRAHAVSRERSIGPTTWRRIMAIFNLHSIRWRRNTQYLPQETLVVGTMKMILIVVLYYSYTQLFIYCQLL